MPPKLPTKETKEISTQTMTKYGTFKNNLTFIFIYIDFYIRN